MIPIETKLKFEIPSITHLSRHELLALTQKCLGRVVEIYNEDIDRLNQGFAFWFYQQSQYDF
jgi:hypothetical protein